MKAKSLLADEDMKPPTREDILKIMADLRVAYENDPTLERRWMFEMSKYIFHIVGEWHMSVSESNRQLEEKVERLESIINSIYRETQQRLNNQELSVNLCLKVADRFFQPPTERDQNGRGTPRAEG